MDSIKNFLNSIMKTNYPVYFFVNQCKKENKFVLKMVRITQTSHIKQIDKEFSKITGITLITNEQG